MRIPLDPTVKAPGVVPLLNDLSSEVAVRTLPLFLANVLGVKTGLIGLIEGLAKSTATLLAGGATPLPPDALDRGGLLRQGPRLVAGSADGLEVPWIWICS